VSLHLIRLLMTSFGGLVGWLAASAYLHRLAPPIPGFRLVIGWLCVAGATGLVARGARRRFYGWGMIGLLLGLPALVVALALNVAATRNSADGGGV
jgi:hypothetical protein